MKETVKVAVMSVRECDVAIFPVGTGDFDPVVFGTCTVTTSYEVYFSDVPSDASVQIKDALSSITNMHEEKYISLESSGPWVDTTPLRIRFSESISAEAVRILTDKFSQFNFKVAEYPYEVNVLTHKCYKINYQQATGSLTINERPTKQLCRPIAETYKYIKSHPEARFDDITIARLFTSSKTDIAFVADDKPQRYEMRFEMYCPILLRLLGCHKAKPRILIRDLKA